MSDNSIYVADPFPIYRSGLRALLTSRCSEVKLREFGDYSSLLATMRKNGLPSVLLFDPMLTGASALTGLRHIQVEFPSAKIIVLSTVASAALKAECLALGAAGFLSKSASESDVCDAIDCVLTKAARPQAGADGHAQAASEFAARLKSLTRMQVRVLLLISRGLLNKQIAHELEVGETTVKAHVTAILRKLGTATRTQAVIKLAELGGNPLKEDDGGGAEN